MKKLAIHEAVERAGSKAHLARALDVSHQLVSQWVARGYASSQKALRIAEVTGVSVEALLRDAEARSVPVSEGGGSNDAPAAGAAPSS